MPKKLSNALKPMQVKTLPHGRHTDGGGLQLLVKKSGARSWVFRFMLDGKSRDIGLGAANGPDAITLADARDKAIDLRRQVRSGIDPMLERARLAAEGEAKAQAAQIAGITFRASAEAFIEAHSDRWSNAKHRAQWRSTLKTYAYPVMGDLSVGDIKTEHVLEVLEPIWKTIPETASRVRGRIENILDAAKVRGHRQGENPARWRGHLKHILPARSPESRGHHRALPFDGIPAFVAALQTRKAMAALALEFAILNVARTGEVIKATWDQVDLQKAIWTIPARNMKNRKQHRIPLSSRSIDILNTTRALGGDYLFAGDKGGGLSNMAMLQLVKRMEADSTVHGLRSSFKDWASETTGFSNMVSEMALAHTIANQAEAAYRRGDLFDKRRKLMEAWARYCTSPVAEKDNVTPIRAGSA